MLIDEENKTIILSRRNLKSLLVKLNGYPKNSACSIIRSSEDGNSWLVKAEEDDTHYKNRKYPPGVMHPATEEAIDG